MRTAIRYSLALTVFALGCAADLSNAQAQPTAPSSLQETYQDWTVTCVQVEGERLCRMIQRLMQENGQLAAAMEIGLVAGEGTLDAVLVLPFGLAVAQPIQLRHGGGDDLTIGVSTCLPAGCLAPTHLEAAWVAQITDTSTLEAVANLPDSSDTATLAFSPKGFQDALERLRRQ